MDSHLTLITSLDYDHPDTYPSEDEYRAAFVQFLEQSDYAILWDQDLRYLQTDPRADLEAYDQLMNLSHLTLAGEHVRRNAYLVERALRRIAPSREQQELVSALNSFPGTARRFEKTG